MQVEYICHMGDDRLVSNVARVSFNKWKEVFDGSDERLINFLAREGHWSPFGHPQITIRTTVPFFVARQDFKHIVGFVRNEVSRRYVKTDPTFYEPAAWRSRPEGSIKQGSGEDLDYDWSPEYRQLLNDAEVLYKDMLEGGVAPEQARAVLPMGTETTYITTGSLAAFARAYKQRIDSDAQVEIQELAKRWDEIISPLYPVSWKVLTE